MAVSGAGGPSSGGMGTAPVASGGNSGSDGITLNNNGSFDVNGAGQVQGRPGDQNVTAGTAATGKSVEGTYTDADGNKMALVKEAQSGNMVALEKLSKEAKEKHGLTKPKDKQNKPGGKGGGSGAKGKTNKELKDKIAKGKDKKDKPKDKTKTVKYGKHDYKVKDAKTASTAQYAAYKVNEDGTLDRSSRQALDSDQVDSIRQGDSFQSGHEGLAHEGDASSSGSESAAPASSGGESSGADSAAAPSSGGESAGGSGGSGGSGGTGGAGGTGGSGGGGGGGGEITVDEAKEELAHRAKGGDGEARNYAKDLAVNYGVQFV